MRINDNGIIREMTAEEIAEYEARSAECSGMHNDSALEFRVAELEMQLKVAKILLGVEE